MYQEESPLIDFYPSDFKVDLNGKKFEWMGVALLPFVDEERLKRVLKKVYPDLTDDERKRNTRGEHYLFVSKWHPLYETLQTAIPDKFQPIKKAGGFSGQFQKDVNHIGVEQNGFKSPIDEPQTQDLTKVCAMGVQYRDVDFGSDYTFIAKLLPGAVMPKKVGLTARRGGRGGSIIYMRANSYQAGEKRKNDDNFHVQQRMINNSLNGPAAQRPRFG